MDDERALNLLGALSLGLVDSLRAAGEAVAGHGGETPAALVSLGADPGMSINTLRYILHLSHPGTVRLVDRLVAEGWVERRAGGDGRTLALFLTEMGWERRQAILTERRHPLERALHSLTPDERQQLTPLLEKMLVAITISEQHAFAICRLCDEAVCPGDRCPVEQTYCRMVDA